MTATLVPEGNWETALSLRSICDSRGSELACTTRNTLEQDLPAGQYFLLVDGWSRGRGPFTLDLRVR